MIASEKKASRRLGHAALCLVAAALGCRESGTFSPAPAPKADAPALPVLIEPTTVTFGALPPGRAARRNVRLRNPGQETATIERVESSCPCVSMAPLPVQVEPGGSTELVVDFDPVHEPDFRGRLAVKLEGFGEDGTPQFRAVAELQVEEPARSPESPTPAAGADLDPRTGPRRSAGQSPTPSSR